MLFIGHSLGSILVMQTLIESCLYSQYHQIRDSIEAIIFFGTPHRGLRTTELCDMVDDKINYQLKVQYLLAQLKEGSEFLENQTESLSGIWNHFRGKVCTFYETRWTKSVKQLESGLFGREGDEVPMVHRLSAQLYLPEERRFPVDSNHSDMVKFDSSQNSAFQTVVTCVKECLDQKCEHKLLEMLSYSVRGLRSPYSDYNDYLNTLLEDEALENNYKFFWIFHGLDYKNWIETGQKMPVLVLCGSPTLENATAHIVRTLKDNLVFHFFYGSVRYLHPLPGLVGSSVEWKQLLCVWTILLQLIDGYPLPQQQYLLESFCSYALRFISPSNIEKITSVEPEEAFRSLLRYSELETLWDALSHTLSRLEWSRGHAESERQDAPRIERHLIFVFDLDDQPFNTCTVWFNIMRSIMRNLRRHFTTVKILVTYPTTDDLMLHHSEVCLKYDTERQECLNTLRFVNKRYENISPCHKNTLEWLWKSDEYNTWKSVEHSSLLFIEGKPGSGKSTMVKYFRDQFFRGQFMLRPHLRDQVLVADFFYSHREGELERSHYHMLRSLLYDILAADESFFLHFQTVFRRCGGRNIVWAYDDLKDILLACGNHPLSRELFLVIDAMDESDEKDRRDIVLLFQKLSDPTNNKCLVKVFLASRPINNLHYALADTCNHILLQEKNTEDIEKFSNAFLGDRVFHSAQNFQEQARKYIVQHADGVFLWVALIREDLMRYADQGRSENQLMKFLKSLPRELGSYYVHMLEELLVHSGDHEDIRDGRRILQFCLFSHRPIQMAELDHALAIPGNSPLPELNSSWESERPIDIRKRVTHCTGNFIEVRKRPTWGLENTQDYAIVQVMHQTVREFFLRPHDAVARSPYLVGNPKEASTMIQLTCIRYLEIHYKEVMLKFQKPKDEWCTDDVCNFIQYLAKRPFIRYSLEYLRQYQSIEDLGNARYLSDLISVVQNSPPSMALTLLKRLANRSAESRNDEDDMNHFLVNDMLGIASKNGFVIAVGNLLAADADCNFVANFKQTPLHFAANGGHEATARLLLEAGADLDAGDTSRQTPLHLAAIKGHIATVRLLLDHGADINAENDCRETPLHKVTMSGDEAMVRLLLDHGANIDASDDIHPTPLHIAALEGHEATVQLLLDRGADIKAKICYGILFNPTPLHRAAMNGHDAIVQLLLNYGADINAESSGYSPLSQAAMTGCIATVRLLLDRGADIMVQDRSFRTALYYAAANGHTGTVQLLLEYGADIEAMDDSCQTPLYQAAKNGHKDTVRLLLDYNANPDRGSLHQTPLHEAAKNGHEATVRLLLDHGTNIKPKDDSRITLLTPLHLAALNRHESTVRLLLSHGFDIEAKSHIHHTPLHLAAMNAHDSMVQLLLDHGANIEAKDICRQTPLSLASDNGRHATIRLLLDRGANKSMII